MNNVSEHKNLSIGDGGELLIRENAVDDVLDEEMEKDPVLRDYFEGDWEKYGFHSVFDGFTAFYEKLQKAGFTDRQKDTIFTRAGIVGWSEKSKDDKTLLYRQAKGAIKDKQKKSKGTKEEEEEFKRKAHFEIDGGLYLEILTTEEQYQFAYLNDDGNVELQDIVGDVAPVELLRTQEGELAGIVKMPNEGIVSCELLNANDLLKKIKEHITSYCDMADRDSELCSYYALFTWFYKKTNTVGYLRFLADTGKGKSRMQTVIGHLCFYPTSAGGSGSFSGMMRIHERWHGTLLIDEGDTKGDKNSQQIKYLNLGLEAGKYYILSDKKNPRYQQVFDPFGPKIIGMREHFRDNATESRLLSISPYETTNENIPILLDKAYEEKTRNLRNEIARFVLAHWNDVDGERMISFKGMGIEPRLQQLAMPLSIIFQLWEEGKEKFKSYITARQKELRKDRALSWTGSMFNLVYAVANGDEELGDDFATFYDGGEIEAITPSMVAKLMNTSTRAATDALRSIGFDVERRWITLHMQMDEEKRKTKKKQVRTYVVPNEKTWREIIQRYYYSEDEENPETDTEIPDVLRSIKFVDDVGETVTTVTSVTNDESVTDKTDVTDIGTPKEEKEFSGKQAKEKPTRTVEDGLLEKGESLKTLIMSFVTDASKRDDRGAMVVASVNRIARDQGLEKGEVKAAIDRIIQEGELVISQDDYGEKFVKVPEF